jgi:hypothetical protein
MNDAAPFAFALGTPTIMGESDNSKEKANGWL